MCNQEGNRANRQERRRGINGTSPSLIPAASEAQTQTGGSRREAEISGERRRRTPRIQQRSVWVTQTIKLLTTSPCVFLSL